MDYFKDIWSYLSVRKKIWLTPIVIVILILLILFLLAKKSIVAPIFYNLF